MVIVVGNGHGDTSSNPDDDVNLSVKPFDPALAQSFLIMVFNSMSTRLGLFYAERL